MDEKLARERLTKKVCQIFGIKSPGPRIWTERKRLQDTYGYTDDTIADCLDYIYNVRHFKKLAESLVLVNPSMVADMRKWKASEAGKAGGIIAAMMAPTEHIEVEIQENEDKEEEINFDDFLMD